MFTTPRLTFWAVLTFVLLIAIALVSPSQLQVVLYKTVLVTFAAVLGYHLDRALFPYARPHVFFNKAETLQKASEFYDANQLRLNAALATLRRAIIVLACVLGMTLGL